MKIRVADYVANALANNGIEHVFTVTGGGAMHLNDALGHKDGLKCVYNHHEQACAIAAESYARIHNKIAAVCVTTGPGGTNAITGVLGGWLDSIPMIIISGQVRYDTTARSTGLGIRAYGDQEFDITKAVSSMTKYCEMVIDPLKIRYCMEKALHMAKTGRPGPCWIDIPLNVQASLIETDELEGYSPDLDVEYKCLNPPKVTIDTAREIVERIKNAKRPVINAGNGIRIAGAVEGFNKLIRLLNVPVVTGWNSIDLIANEDELYVGRAGIMGDRPGNWAIQNSDLVLSIGSRLSVRQVGYNYETWAREAFTIVEDVDKEELKKPSLRIDMPVWADASDLIEMLIKVLDGEVIRAKTKWNEKCKSWKMDYPVVMPKHYENQENTNVYAFIHELSSKLPEGRITVVGNGSACVVGSHAYVIKKNQRFIINSAVASMGYDLPAAIGACFGTGIDEIICVTGDGSIQMNLQELQTIIHHRLPIKIFVINNHGYHSIRQTQKNFFGEPLVGIGDDSGDLSFPDMDKLSAAYGYEYRRISHNKELDNLDEILSIKGPLICEVMVDTQQKFEPKSATKKLDNGALVSSPLEDLAPFLPKEELEKVMVIPLLEEER